MERIAFILRLPLATIPDGTQKLVSASRGIQQEASSLRLDNFSIWSINDLLLCYGESDEPGDQALAGADALCRSIIEKLGKNAELLCAPGTMRLMYHDIGVVRKDKSLIRHRVFCTKLKDGCEEEYKRRHDALINARTDAVREGPDSNFTIWYGAGYIFGYCEKVRSFDHEPTIEERQADIAWETRQLEIMDWLTDDVDWITGQHHDPICRLV